MVDAVGEAELTTAGVSGVELGTGSGVADGVVTAVSAGGVVTAEDTGTGTTGTAAVGSEVGAAGAAAKRGFVSLSVLIREREISWDP